jgi:pimeloyl-ACP methyl ester carboxylesterase
MPTASVTDRLKPCPAADGLSDGYCGTLEVFEDRQAKAGRKISLRIVVLPALKQKYALDPVFFLAGGPGQGAAELADLVREPFRTIEKDRDLVFVDQRGTGKSNPLECKLGEDDSDDLDSGGTVVRRLQACLDSYKNKADVTKYTTPIAMDDLDDVRQYLGYGKINLYGGSYGTRAALVYARRHADHTRAVIIDGVAPTDMRLPLYMARDSQRALDLLFRDCEKDKACSGRFPKLRDRWEALMAKLAAHPQHVRFVHPRTGLEKEMDVKRLTVAGTVFASLYASTTAAMMPLLIEEAEKGNFTGLLAISAPGEALSSNMAVGMHFSVVCSEDAPRIGPGAVAREAANTFLGPEMAEDRLKPCAFWPRGQVEASYYDNTPSDLPGLILSGEADPVTPPSWGAQVASAWKNSKHIVVPATGHGTWAHGCVMKLMAQFLNEGSASRLDASCVNKVERPPFFLGPSGPDPMLGAGSGGAQ